MASDRYEPPKYLDAPDPHEPERIEWRYYPDGSIWPYETTRDRIFPTIGITSDRLDVLRALNYCGEIMFGVPGGAEPIGVLHAIAETVPLDKGGEMAERFVARVRGLLAD